MRLRRHTITAAILGCLVAIAIAAPAVPAGTPAGRCAELFPGGTVNTPDPDRATGAVPLPSSWPTATTGLPRHVHLRSSTASYNRLYEFALADGDLFARRKGDGRWRQVPLPGCMQGQLTGISADDDEMIGIDGDRNIYTMDNALKAPALWNWTKRWGPTFWAGDGFAIPADTKAWSWSVISPAEDKTWTDPAGNHRPVGEFKVSHIWGLRGSGQVIDFWDPWLPRDNSYQMCGPHDSRFRAVNISASGSHVFIVGKHGDLFTRLYDFDISGHDKVFFPYSYADQTGAGDDAPIQLPAEPWTRQPKIDGKITSAISISKRGFHAVHGTLRVEGRHRGRVGYWQRDLAAPRSRGWNFHPTGGRLEGHLLDNPPGNTSRRGLAPSRDMRYVMRDGDTRAVISDFSVHCSPAHIELHQGGTVREVVLHHPDGLRQVERASGLDDEPRLQFAALVWPSGEIEDDLQLFATRDALEIPSLGWTFERSER